MNTNTPISELPNIGKVVTAELEAIGIKTYGDLAKVGSAEAILRIRKNSGTGCISMLYGLEGAIQGVRWHDMSIEKREKAKKELKRIFDQEGMKL